MSELLKRHRNPDGTVTIECITFTLTLSADFMVDNGPEESSELHVLIRRIIHDTFYALREENLQVRQGHDVLSATKRVIEKEGVPSDE